MSISLLKRRCCTCEQEKPLLEFYRSKSDTLGYGYRCKECELKRSRQPEVIARTAQNHKSEHGKVLARLAQSRKRKTTPEKYRAKELIQRLVRRGSIQKECCSVCREANTQGHHPDYSRPLEVVWLCQFHHSQAHRGKLSPRIN